MDVPAGQTRTIRLHDLAPRTTLTLVLVASGRVLVAMVSEKHLRLRGSDGRGPLFRAVVEGKREFKLRIPEPGTYFLVLSNRGGSTALKVQTEIHSVSPLPDTKEKLQRTRTPVAAPRPIGS
jgi:hypothetical protein